MLANIALLIGISIAWAAGYFFVRDADADLPPITSTAVMAGVASVVLIVAVLALRRPLLDPLRKRAWLPLVMAFSAIAIPNFTVAAAERTVQAELAAVLGTTVPIVTLLITTFVTRQTRYSPLRSLGVAVALAGLVIFVGLGNLLSNDLELFGMLIMVSGGLIFAVNGVVLGAQTRDLDEYALATWTMIFGALVLTIVALVTEGVPSPPRGDILLSLIGEGTIGMGLAYLGYYVLVARAGAYFGSLYAFLVPPFGVIAAALVFGDRLTLSHLLGITIVLTGLALMLRPARTASQSSGKTSSS